LTVCENFFLSVKFPSLTQTQEKLSKQKSQKKAGKCLQRRVFSPGFSAAAAAETGGSGPPYRGNGISSEPNPMRGIYQSM